MMDPSLERPLADVMTYRPVTIRCGATLAEAGGLFEAHGVHCLPVLDGGRLVGVVSRVDLLRAVGRAAAPGVGVATPVLEQPVESVMSRCPVTVGPDMPLGAVLERMLASGHQSFPVVIGALVIGIVTSRDVVRALWRGRQADEGEAPPFRSP
jgi:tRNA nucleotidyltransferase (CCA-adding enzyme)